VRTPLSIAVVGLGSRGSELARTFDELPGAELRWLCDSSREAERRASARHPGAVATADLGAVLSDETLDAVAIATPAATHADLARRCLEAQKHVLVQQPLALDAVGARLLVDLAERRQRRLTVANPALYEPAMRKLKELIELGRLGEIYYVQVAAQTCSPGAGEESVLWGLGVSLVHALLYLLDDEPVEALVRADAYARPGVVEVAACWFKFATGITATAHMSWLDPRERERLAVVGARRTAVFDARAVDRKLTVFERPPAARRVEEPRYGEIVTPRLAAGDPIQLECESFLSAVRTGHDVAPHQAAAAVAVVEELHRTITAEDAAAAPPPPRRLELVQ
jgi:UDP-2-acetamido-3-amino-2,3-dideoxy-glucuronate N-acetyltransferase